MAMLETRNGLFAADQNHSIQISQLFLRRKSEEWWWQSVPKVSSAVLNGT
jgi:hypothetical protein